MKLLNSQLTALGHERRSSLHVSNISEDRDRVVRDNKYLDENQEDATRDHTGSFARANLTENPVKLRKRSEGTPNRWETTNITD